ncbi:MAG TPA: PIN domain-containing protein [Bacteroidia bacterium]|nr:PIN domain-containing protein [Bacteroidia bacterium]
MNGKFFLLDTNIIIALFSGEASVVSRIEKAEEVFVPVIVIGELLYGAEMSTRKEQNIKKLSEFSSTCNIVDCTYETAKHYSLVKSFLKKKGILFLKTMCRLPRLLFNIN